MHGWEQIEIEDDEVVCFQRPNPDTLFDSFKADVFIDVPPQTVARYLFNNWSVLNMELNDDVSSYDILYKPDDNIHILDMQTGSQNELVVKRHFKLIAVFLELSNSTFAIASTSIDMDAETQNDEIHGD